MTNTGFDEAHTNYDAGNADSLVGQFRRFGEAGPAYEIMKVKSESHAAIRVVYSGEELDYSIEHLKAEKYARRKPSSARARPTVAISSRSLSPAAPTTNWVVIDCPFWKLPPDKCTTVWPGENTAF